MLSPGVLLGKRYRLDERIAGGGMGDVWRGTDEVLGRTVAIKILLPALLDEPGFAERFRGEARTMATINHPGVVDIYDYGSGDPVAYLIMEYVEGDALSRTLARVGRLKPARVMALVAQAADALQAAHDKGIVHRDVKPGNLLVRPNGTLVLTDFGIARSAMAGQLTAAGSVLGTASYISPEQAAGGVATPASDLYSLGVVAYQCLAGHRPFEGESPLEIAMKHVRDTPRALPSDIPPIARSIVERSMSKDPAARWPSASALSSVARQAASTLGGSGFSSGPAGPISVPPVSSSSRPGHPASPVPVSPNPVSPVPAVAGQTRVQSPAAGQHQPHGVGPAAGRPAPPVGYHRGAAAVPAPRQPGAGPHGYATRSINPAAYPPPRRRNPAVTALVVVAVVLAVLLFAGVIGWLVRILQDSADGRGSGPGGTETRTTSAYVQLGCDKLERQSEQEATRYLEARGLRVNIDRKPGSKAGKIDKIDPCSVAPNGTVTLTVRGGGGGG